mgnify:CR=1 FL=1
MPHTDTRPRFETDATDPSRVMLSGQWTLDTALDVAERIREKIATTSVEVDGQKISMTASFGVACYPAPGINDLNDLLKAADKALYEAKESGRNRVVQAREAEDSEEPDLDMVADAH